MGGQVTLSDMLDDLLRPEAHKDPYQWATAFAGHYWIALGPWGVIAIGWTQWQAAVAVPVLYLLLWEGYQLYRAQRITRALVWDSLLDTTGVAMACLSAASLGNDLKLTAVSCWVSSVIVAVVGWRVRSSRHLS